MARYKPYDYGQTKMLRSPRSTLPIAVAEQAQAASARYG
jgi:hypothetical protein